MKNKLSEIIRIITIPCIISLILILLLWFFCPNSYLNLLHLFFAILFICIFPLLTYPICYFIPKLRNKGKSFQRKLTIVFSIIGYIVGFLFALITKAPPIEMILYSTYLFSVAILIAYDLIFKSKASGHSSSITGPIAMLCYSLSLYYLFGIIIIALVYTSSIILKRHTFLQLLLGSLFSIIGFCISVLIFA